MNFLVIKKLDGQLLHHFDIFKEDCNIKLACCRLMLLCVRFKRNQVPILLDQKSLLIKFTTGLMKSIPPIDILFFNHFKHIILKANFKISMNAL